MANLNSIIEKLKTEQSQIQKNFDVKRIGIFGSYVRNEQNSKSDLDILVEFSEAPGLFKFIELEDYLSKKTGIKVDLVMKSALKPAIGKEILKEVIYL